MTFGAGAVFALLDGARRRVGEITVERVEDDLVFAGIRPGPDFAAVEPLFRAFEEAVESQALKRVDALDAAIAALKLHLVTADDKESVPVHDVQIWSDGGMTCRVPPVASTEVKGVVEPTALPDLGGEQGVTPSLAEGKR